MHTVEEVRTNQQIEDIIALAVLFHAETSAHLAFDPECIRAYGRAIQQDFDREHYTAFVAYRDHDPVGFIVCTASHYFFSREVCARQELWYVKPGLRGTRVAFDLIRAFEEWSRLRGAVEIFTGVAAGDIEKQKKTSRILTRIGYPRIGSYHKRITFQGLRDAG